MEITLLTILGISYAVIIVVALLFYLLTTTNEKKYKLEPAGELRKEPFVSIIVPTLNEERNIGKCLSSLAKLNYTNYEIIVSDGGSTDRTVAIASKYTDKIIIDETLPRGWIGKNYGCHIGFLQAKGEYLLFTDADTVHYPDSLRKTVQTAIENNAALLSMTPYQLIEKWWESLVPIFFFASTIISGGRGKINDPSKPNNFMGTGQYMLFTRSAYDKIGGHKRIQGSIVEDLVLTYIVKQELGYLYYMSPDKDLVTTQMYPDSFKQCWNGWKKCVYPGTKFFPAYKITGTLAWYLWGFFAPVAIVLAALYGTWLHIVLTTIAYFLGGLSLFSFWQGKGKHLIITYLFYPLLYAGFCIVLGASAMEILVTKKTTWRGRSYNPDIYAGMETSTLTALIGDSNRIAQLETDVEIELNDIITVQHSKQTVPGMKGRDYSFPIYGIKNEGLEILSTNDANQLDEPIQVKSTLELEGTKSNKTI